MAFTAITKPTQGDATKKSLIDAMIDNESFLNTEISGVKVVQIPNPSFEVDSDSDGIPDRWTRTLYTGGAFSRSNSAGDYAHGAYGIKFTHPSGGGNGGGYLDSEDFFECSEYQRLFISWLHYCSVAGMHDLVEVKFYTGAQVLISTSTIYDSTANPTSWATQSGVVIPPATARYAKIRITGGKSDVDPGVSAVSHWDNIRIFDGTELFNRTLTFKTAGTHYWTPPSGTTTARVRLWAGGGGGGGSASANAACGGGGGQYCESIVTVTAGTAYPVVVGAGGAGGTGANNGTAGSDSTFNTTTIVAKGGSGGGQPGGSGGAGGTGGTSMLAFDGLAGEANVTTVSGAGGHSLAGGCGGLRRTTGANGFTGETPGGGGGGAGSSANGGTGAAGQAIVEY